MPNPFNASLKDVCSLENSALCDCCRPGCALAPQAKHSGSRAASQPPMHLRRRPCCALCCRPDKKNAQYQATIKQGDLVLNRLQKLAKVADVE